MNKHGDLNVNERRAAERRALGIPDSPDEPWDTHEPHELAQNRDARAWLAAHNYYYCGRCRSLIPVGYWHRCDDSGAHSAPHERSGQS